MPDVLAEGDAAHAGRLPDLPHGHAERGALDEEGGAQDQQGCGEGGVLGGVVEGGDPVVGTQPRAQEEHAHAAHEGVDVAGGGEPVWVVRGGVARGESDADGEEELVAEVGPRVDRL